jgi:hypothetical protein
MKSLSVNGETTKPRISPSCEQLTTWRVSKKRVVFVGFTKFITIDV